MQIHSEFPRPSNKSTVRSEFRASCPIWLDKGLGPVDSHWPYVRVWRGCSFTWIVEGTMIVGERLRLLREAKNLSQGDVEKRTGLLRCYISRVENGHTVPAVETLEKFCRALEVPLYQIFYEGEQPPKLPNLTKGKRADNFSWGDGGKYARFWRKLLPLLARMSQTDRRILLSTAQKMATR